MKNTIKTPLISIFSFFISFTLYHKVWNVIEQIFNIEIFTRFISSELVFNIFFASVFGVIPIISYILNKFYKINNFTYTYLFILLISFVVSIFRLYFILDSNAKYFVEDVKFELYLHIGWVISVILILVLYPVIKKTKTLS